MSLATAVHQACCLAAPVLPHQKKHNFGLPQTPCLLFNAFLGTRALRPRQLLLSKHCARQHWPRLAQCQAPRASAGNVGTDVEGGRALFRAEQRRAEVLLPAFVVSVSAGDVLTGGKTLTENVDEACAGGATMVLLTEEGDAAGGGGGGALYEAACVLQRVIRGRAQLLIAERADIAAAAGADGVLLSAQGLPTVVARRMLGGVSASEMGVLPLVGRVVATASEARTAAAEGADLLVLSPSPRQKEEAQDATRAGVGVPLVAIAKGNDATAVVGAGADGVVVSLIELEGGRQAVKDQLERVRAARSKGESAEGEKLATGGNGSVKKATKSPGLGQDLQLIDESGKLLIEEERTLLTRLRDLLEEATPEMSELSLLEDALEQLDQLFLLVIVGEFNSGKSSVINALLGAKFLKDGVVPTTNEITLLQHTGDGHAEGTERSERHPDGHVLRYLPASLLKQMSVVDTPGTNVILERQQRLTEEFVPRADLVLFVLSADRALTESEVSFLRYIRQWGKKVVFLLNKADLLSSEQELDEVTSFVANNAIRLLGVDSAPIYPVSARRALRAKLAAPSSPAGGPDPAHLTNSPDWTSSGFSALEDFIAGFLGGGAQGAERMRLKLDTPLGVGAALLAAARGIVAGEGERASEDLAALEAVQEQVAKFRAAMEKDAGAQREKSARAVAEAAKRAGRLVDRILTISNVSALGKYLLGSVQDDTAGMPVASRFQRDVADQAIADVKQVIDEHGTWLAANNARQISNYADFVRARWPGFSEDFEDQPGAQLVNYGGGDNPHGREALEEFNPSAAALVLDNEVREVVLGLAANTGGAGALAYGLTTVLPTTLEDLLALTVCSLLGYAGILTLPQKRGEVKKKVRRSSEKFAAEIEEAMRKDMEEELDRMASAVEELIAPYRQAALEEVARVNKVEAQLSEVDADLRTARSKVRRFGE
ncbi:Dynamin subfamily FZL [Klebsormidium nitens]|uniref:Dynamin subfamily FZL n=1 Tax=Klebsormidium nitens TaxID=105231 RepID=A0A1Y1HSC8_KLENI|nr:Dynamin subfamily FZL [Klebsormidium nitens]|eukprot:GAQ81535.1 Dynamin subfamily FZL [Klebsormidium nitens]